MTTLLKPVTKILGSLAVFALAGCAILAGGLWWKVMEEEHDFWDQIIEAATGPETEETLLGFLSGSFTLVEEKKGFFHREAILKLKGDEESEDEAPVFVMTADFGLTIKGHIKTAQPLDLPTIRGSLEGGLNYDLLNRTFAVTGDVDKLAVDMAQLEVRCDRCSLKITDDNIYEFKWSGDVFYDQKENGVSLMATGDAGYFLLAPHVLNLKAKSLIEFDVEDVWSYTFKNPEAMVQVNPSVDMTWDMRSQDWFVHGVGSGTLFLTRGQASLAKMPEDWSQRGLLSWENWNTLLDSIASLNPIGLKWCDRKCSMMALKVFPLGESMHVQDPSTAHVEGVVQFDEQSIKLDAEDDLVTVQEMLELPLPAVWQGTVETDQDGQHVWTPKENVVIPPDFEGTASAH